MRRLIRLAGETQLAVPCLEGEEIRILAVRVAVPPGTDFDQINISMGQTGGTVIQMASPLMAAATVNVMFAMGLGVVTTFIDGGGNPVQVESITAGLPDIWWNYECNVTVGAAGGPATEVLYETRKAV